MDDYGHSAQPSWRKQVENGQQGTQVALIAVFTSLVLTLSNPPTY